MPFRIFFEGEDNNFLQFDGKLNPMMLVLTPFAFIGRKGANRGASDLISDRLILLLFAALVILISMGANVIRIRYLIAIIAPVVMLNIFALDNLLRQKKVVVTCLSYVSIGIYIIYNVVYGYHLEKDLDHIKYVLGKESKTVYISRKLEFYPIYQYINQHTDQSAVVYDVMSGHRSYYVDREYMYAPRHVDVVFMNYMVQHKNYTAYEHYLRSLKTRHGVGVTHLLIRPGLLVNTYQRMFPAHDPIAIQHFVHFLKRQKVVAQAEDAVLFELVARPAEPLMTPERSATSGS